MPFLFALLGGLLSIVGSMVGRVLLALGLSYVTFSGFDLAIDWLFDELKGGMASMPPEVVDFVAWLWVDKAIGLLFSTWSAAMVIKLAGSDKLTKLVMK